MTDDALPLEVPMDQAVGALDEAFRAVAKDMLEDNDVSDEGDSEDGIAEWLLGECKEIFEVRLMLGFPDLGILLRDRHHNQRWCRDGLAERLGLRECIKEKMKRDKK